MTPLTLLMALTLSDPRSTFHAPLSERICVEAEKISVEQLVIVERALDIELDYCW